MEKQSHENAAPQHYHCCPGCSGTISRRGFLGAAALGGAALSGLSWTALAAGADEPLAPPARNPLKVLPVFVYSTASPRPQASWRHWGGIETEAQAEAERGRIRGELERLVGQADFPLEPLPIASVKSPADAAALGALDEADALVVYAAGAWKDVYDALGKLGKPTVIFVRYKSGPLYLWYEIIIPRYLRQHTDELQVAGIDFDDVVVDDPQEILWRLRSLCGLKNTVGSRILAVGGPGGWACPQAPDLARKRFQLDIQTISYDELGKLVREALADAPTAERARRRAEAYLKLPGTTLETKREFVDRCFVLDEIFRQLMQRTDCRALTINACMGTIMNVTETTGCLPLSTLNDDGYLAFCESDFVAIPSGLLLGNICGLPVFLHNPTFPHKGFITLAHCTAPRKMNGKDLEPARVMTHFESDYGAAPKVEMRAGQRVTLISPDFSAERWMGMVGEILDAPFLPICRSQIDVRFAADDLLVAQRMRGFHWMLCYGDYQRELGYALRRVGIEWDYLGSV